MTQNLAGAETKRIVVVDDNAANARVIERMLRRAGLPNVACYTSAAHALAEIVAQPPALLVADLHMPECTGWELLDRIRKQIRAEHLPAVLIISGDVVDTQDVHRGYTALQCMQKPISYRDLVDTVERLLGC